MDGSGPHDFRAAQLVLKRADERYSDVYMKRKAELDAEADAKREEEAARGDRDHIESITKLLEEGPPPIADEGSA